MFYRDEDEGFIALAPNLPGCSAFGETQEQAVAESRDAIVAWQLAARSARESGSRAITAARRCGQGRIQLPIGAALFPPDFFGLLT
ncbi:MULTISPECIES: type II toxin-antitoxin system HicB family antitoxin [Rhodopseudomonas]|uniref:HicB-like antitoxin of toxin-antitoxin system domain-containing protein n=1 Tax=Rhodopseudomonas palustris TaxID=1076 RepID=A0A0D7EU45_RHOPL|nr:MULTISPECIES: type II toxin-antitoxin system HicB family antitoxin [Rhodopseudomonas]KIZ42957.1 hypothetical protein OO17_12085 [Rhodopseudomonas palustris]MDF3813981.1 type II toxin-antitoxin system HicB family antitoxin [Rhodopseudomonas sp. BAL398]WOK19942.1 type II toxin-antitoxin system HicB family antitoxin [Rhodopseudomonas sp. BAL398]